MIRLRFYYYYKFQSLSIKFNRSRQALPGINRQGSSCVLSVKVCTSAAHALSAVVRVSFYYASGWDNDTMGARD